MRTRTKITAALLMILVTALTATAVLTYVIYDRVLSGLVVSRFEFIARELKRKVEAGLDLGLPLGELDNLTELLRQQILTDDALVSLSIVNARGVVLFDTEAARIGTKTHAAWLDAAAQGRVARASPNDTEIGVAIVNSFGKVVGGLLVTYSKAYYDEKRAKTVQNLGEATVLVLLLGSLVGLCGVLAITRPLEHTLIRLEASLNGMFVRTGLASRIAPAEGELEREIADFESNMLTAIVSVERAHAELAAETPFQRSG